MMIRGSGLLFWVTL